MSADLAEIQAQYELKKAEGETRGAAMLARIEAFLIRFVAYPSAHAVVAHVLWIVHTHAMAAWESTPRIAFLSPEPASGKTRALEVSELLVPRPIEAVNTSPAYLFRKVSDPDGLPTILFDEIDTVFGPKAKKDNEEIRGMLNAGHRRGAVAGRCTVKGKKIITEELPAYCAVALAGLGNLPDTLMSRSIPIPMRRRSPTETVEPFRRRIHAPEGESFEILSRTGQRLRHVNSKRQGQKCRKASPIVPPISGNRSSPSPIRPAGIGPDVLVCRL